MNKMQEQRLRRVIQSEIKNVLKEGKSITQDFDKVSNAIMKIDDYLIDSDIVGDLSSAMEEGDLKETLKQITKFINYSNSSIKKYTALSAMLNKLKDSVTQNGGTADYWDMD